ncbi:HRDC domain-containing protein [Alkalihalobacillus sp. R86527]|uniref:HRDC domain-containing protein n=1 Tax=Alkalihalobacillus sp. R86527 TaxID=3093863 RepID=UPI00366E0251
MSFLKTVFNIFTDNREIKEPTVYKDIEENSNMVNFLTDLKTRNDGNLDTKKIEKHLKLFSIGHTGEKSVMFELQHSMLPLLILHDVHLEFENYKAQIDFIVITHKFILVLEVKKLFGNIRITDKGEFQRVITKNNRVVNKEGMYSPVNQAERHVNILEKLLKSKGIITKCPIRGAVTFANPKTIIDMSPDVPADIQSRVIRHDQIKSFIKDELDSKSPVFMLDHSLHEIAQVILQNNKEQQFNVSDYTLKKLRHTKKTSHHINPTIHTNTEHTNEKLKASLVEFRLQRSKELNMKPYHIFTNKIVDELLEKKPNTLNQLLEIDGIGPKKVEDFGDDILTIIKSRAPKENNNPTNSKENNTIQLPNTDPSKNPSSSEKGDLIVLRTKKAQERKVKPYYIFTNSTLEDLLKKKPRTVKELLNVEGFGIKKVEEFGDEVIMVFNKDK